MALVPKILITLNLLPLEKIIQFPILKKILTKNNFTSTAKTTVFLSRDKVTIFLLVALLPQQEFCDKKLRNQSRYSQQPRVFRGF